MSAKLTFLGTGHAMVTKCYNTCFVLEEEGRQLLVDAGGGNLILTRFEQAGLSWKGLHDLFVTHSHTDHVMGVVWVIRKIATLILEDLYEGNFTIWCHKDLVPVIRGICELTLAQKHLNPLGSRICFRIVEDGEQAEVAGFPVEFFDLGSQKRKQFGFRICLADGQVLVCLGDELFHESSRSYVTGCDWLLREAFCLYEERERFRPYEKAHSTVLEAGREAQKLGVLNLVLYHTEDSDLDHRKERYTREAAAGFSGRVLVPDDLDVVELEKYT